jgi:hypothetical protein
VRLYFPVKRVMCMPPRACPSVPLFRAAVYGGQACLSVSARWGTACCEVAPAAPPRLPNALWQGVAGACPTSAAVHAPRSPWAEPAGSPRDTSRWPLPPEPVRAAADDLLEQRRSDMLLPPWLGRRGQPCHRPAPARRVPGARLLDSGASERSGASTRDENGRDACHWAHARPHKTRCGSSGRLAATLGQPPAG